MMTERERLERRRAFFKALACQSHTWPNMACERCHDRLMRFAEENMDTAEATQEGWVDRQGQAELRAAAKAKP